MNETKAAKVNIGGVGISNLYFSDLLALLSNSIEQKEKLRVCITPVNCIVWANQNAILQNIYNSADLTLCDGGPLIWASRFLGNKIRERITGLDLQPKFLEACAKNGHTLFFLGAKEGVAEILKSRAEALYPGIKILGTYCPPMAETFSDAENQKMIDLINAVKPNVLMVSLTAPKQDFWIAAHLDQLDVNIAIGLGGAFEVSAGLIQRAPVWMQKSGLEWLYRFLKEPKRLFNRYFIEAPLIFPIIWKQKIK
jgi:N-acetylglucosaminyldiphosphoundecaprenol N-acetyl-beta-D-mannosaminyltransferase